MKNYYRIATNVSLDCSKLNRSVMIVITNRLRELKKTGRKLTPTEKGATVNHCHHKIPKSQGGTDDYQNHRILKAQVEEVERNGDTSLARLFSRVLEKYVGIISCQEDDELKLEQLKKFRGLRKQHFDLVMKIDAMTKEAEELEVKDAVQISSTGAKSLVDSEEYKRQEFVSKYLLAMKNKMLTTIAQVNKWKRVIISQHDAEEHARLE